MIKKESIEALKDTIDIVDILSSYMELQKNGANFKALCPFHGEKTPSLIVSPAKQIFHCFGCHAGGDTITFVMDYEKINYVETIEKLANEYNFTLEYDKNSRDNYKANNGFSILREFMMFAQKKLSEKVDINKYLEQRNIFETSIEKFEIGYAPSSSDTMSFLAYKNISNEDAYNAGILTKNDSNYYARFIERITFPIYNTSSKVVGFGGRTTSNHPAKYINSTTNSFFNKSKTLYGLNLAKDEIHKKNEIIITEGYLDTIMLHQAGFKNVVATLGTALTKEHIILIKKFTQNIIIAYDGDSAGMEASHKASILFLNYKIHSRIALFKKDQDPADLVSNNEIEELKHILTHTKPSIEFVLDNIIKKYDLASPEDKQKAYDEVIDFISPEGDIIKNEYKKYISDILHIDESFIKFKNKEISNQTTKQNTIKKKLLPNENQQELEIIKTIIQYPEQLDFVLECLDTIHFDIHKNEFEKLKKGDLADTILVMINFREDIMILNDEDLLKTQIIFLLKSYYQKLRKIDIKHLSFNEKLNVKKLINDKLKSLDDNILVSFDESILKYFKGE